MTRAGRVLGTVWGLFWRRAGVGPHGKPRGHKVDRTSARSNRPGTGRSGARAGRRGPAHRRCLAIAVEFAAASSRRSTRRCPRSIIYEIDAVLADALDLP